MKVILVAIGLLVGTAATVHAQDTAFAPGNAAAARNSGAISTARDLYAAARYDEALALLNGLNPADIKQPAERRTIEQYRALCLLALGRGAEAETAIGAVVTADPFHQPSEAEASPRFRATFSDVRQRLLPTIATTRYSAAKSAYDRKEFAEAERQFRELLALLNDPHMNGRLPDLRVLTAGFVELAAAAAAPPPAPAPAKTEEPPPAPNPAAPAAPRVYNSDEAGITPPKIVRQELPSVPAAIVGMVRDRAVLELIIDEQGRVAQVTVRVKAHPVYDTMLVNAAKDWKYQPATLEGAPVRFRKLIQVTVSR